MSAQREYTGRIHPEKQCTFQSLIIQSKSIQFEIWALRCEALDYIYQIKLLFLLRDSLCVQRSEVNKARECYSL